MKENRRHIRIDADLEVTYRIVNDYARSWSRSIDISKGGIRLPSNQKLPIGTILQLEIHTALSFKPLTMRGCVVWVNEQNDGKFLFEMGIKFINILPDDLRILYHLCGEQMEGRNTIRWIG
jgi:c-di-GMP-binding flagellar brake protein YcgR